MLSTNGTYSVQETDLFSEKPIVQKRGKKVSDKQRYSRNGYINPQLHTSGKTNVKMAPQQRIVRRHTHFTQGQANRQPVIHANSRHGNTGTRPGELPHLNQTEVLRMKKNNFIEAKSLMMVFDEILRNSTGLDALEGGLTR